jgi:hypothetical protein
VKHGLQTKESTWYLLKLSAMSTIVREWVALQHAHVCPFADIMVGCQPRSVLSVVYSEMVILVLLCPSGPGHKLQRSMLA